MKVPASPSVITAQISPGILLDARRALIHPAEGWMAVTDLHYGYEIHRSRQGALLPDWGMNQCRTTLLALIHDHQPRRLILVGDIMDGSGSVAQTGAFLDELRNHVADLILIEGNHDRTALKKGWPFLRYHREGSFVFHHGHLDIALPSISQPALRDEVEETYITGHEHPAVTLRDGAGLKLKLPAFIQQRTSHDRQNWVLPAFSPWAAGGAHTSPNHPQTTWVCSPGRVWKLR
ncbi:putative phosphoesterase [Prosthecobacter fusiformis]|uniref:Putative phosphoesterase n=1 Tax=Prosthecobacter fusiformis TaxID=48464 RepID=A0A4R7RKM0_9BACT|nr:metallophosphoesterase [Prosthecobacter fusiformis]TDU64649.1 putative phosphoesterase [Prosthecobacter fusiformis]